MRDRVERWGLQVDAALAHFIDTEVLLPLRKDVGVFWKMFAWMLPDLVQRNRYLLAKLLKLLPWLDRNSSFRC